MGVECIALSYMCACRPLTRRSRDAVNDEEGVRDRRRHFFPQEKSGRWWMRAHTGLRM